MEKQKGFSSANLKFLYFLKVKYCIITSNGKYRIHVTKIALTEVSIKTTVESNPKKIIIPPEPNSIKRNRAFCIIPNMKKNKTIKVTPPAKYK